MFEIDKESIDRSRRGDLRGGFFLSNAVIEEESDEVLEMNVLWVGECIGHDRWGWVWQRMKLEVWHNRK